MRYLALVLAGSLVLPVWAKRDTRIWKSKYANGKQRAAIECYVDFNGKKRAHGESRYWYPSGRKYMLLHYVENQRHGPATVWYENRKLKEEGEYIEGQRDGTWTLWHENGNKMATGRYRGNQRVGTWTEWHEDGKLMRTASFLKGERNGVYKHYWPNGRLRYQGTFQKGKRHGLFQRWFESGVLESAVTYQDNLRYGVARYYYDSRKPDVMLQRSEYNFEANRFVGESRTWNRSGDLLCFGKYQDDTPHLGTFWEEGPTFSFTITRRLDGRADVTEYDPTPTVYTITRFENGQAVDAVLYDNGRPVTGLLTEHFGPKQVNRMCEYAEGRKSGREVRFWEDGEMRSECTWVSNQLEGIYRQYRPSGMISWEVECHNGVKDGRESRWDNWGNLIAQGVNRDGKPWSGLLMAEELIETKLAPAEVEREGDEAGPRVLAHHDWDESETDTGNPLNRAEFRAVGRETTKIEKAEILKRYEKGVCVEDNVVLEPDETDAVITPRDGKTNLQRHRPGYGTDRRDLDRIFDEDDR